ncbi:hypothetical protein BGZ76_008254 [Entomortierella beljakovae]|nr:hypothetical protein BGZ76_008254 [Entomortierella beljakovae]
MSEIPTFQHIALSYLEDISAILGEHIALHDRRLNLVQRVNPLMISRRAIRDAQRVCSSNYGRSAPSVMIQTLNPNITTTYVEEFLHRNIYELLKNSMRATCEAHLQEGSPVSLGMSRGSIQGSQGSDTVKSKKKKNGESIATASTEPKLPPISLTLVDGGEDVTIKISDNGSGLCLSELENIWSYVRPLNQSSSLPPPTAVSTTACAFVGGLSSEHKDYLDLPLAGSGHGLPLARLMAQYFGGDLSLISMEGHGTDSYLSLFRDDDHPENFPEMDQDMLDEVDIFVDELLESYNNNSNSEIPPSSPTSPPPPATVTTVVTPIDIPLNQISTPRPTFLPESSLSTSMPASMAVGLQY